MERPKKILKLTKHALVKMADRGVSLSEIEEAIRIGQREPAQRGLVQYRLNLEYDGIWGKEYYKMKQVVPIVAEEPDEFVIITVYAFYFQEEREP